MQLIKSKNTQWTEKRGYSKKIFLNEKNLNIPGALIQKIKIKPGEIAKNHFHKKQTEIFYFLNANGYFVVNNEQIKIQKEDVLVIEPFDMHEVVNDTDEDFLYMAFKYHYSEDDLFWEEEP